MKFQEIKSYKTYLYSQRVRPSRMLLKETPKYFHVWGIGKAVVLASRSSSCEAFN